MIAARRIASWAGSIPQGRRSDLLATIDKVMQYHPIYWKDYYLGSKEQQRLLRLYIYSDRIRYYWNNPEIAAAVGRLLTNVEAASIPNTVLSQYLPVQYQAVRAGQITAISMDFIHHKIRSVLQPYSNACLNSAPPA